MKDDKGLYYLPNPSQPESRVYVRQGVAGIEFRLWHSAHPDVWDKHDWIPLEIIRKAASLYKESGSGADPLNLYDEAVARALLSGK